MEKQEKIWNKCLNILILEKFCAEKHDQTRENIPNKSCFCVFKPVKRRFSLKSSLRATLSLLVPLKQPGFILKAAQNSFHFSFQKMFNMKNDPIKFQFDAFISCKSPVLLKKRTKTIKIFII